MANRLYTKKQREALRRIYDEAPISPLFFMNFKYTCLFFCWCVFKRYKFYFFIEKWASGMDSNVAAEYVHKSKIKLFMLPPENNKQILFTINR